MKTYINITDLGAIKAPRQKGIDSLKKIVCKKNDNDPRIVLQGVLHEKGKLIASDSHVLVALNKQEYNKEMEGKIIRPSDELNINAKYPNWRDIIPKNAVRFVMNADQLASAANKQVLKAKTEQKNTKECLLIFQSLCFAVFIDPQRVLNVLQTLRANGATKLNVKIAGDTRAIIFEDKQNGHIGLVMPYGDATETEDCLYVKTELTNKEIDNVVKQVNKRVNRWEKEAKDPNNANLKDMYEDMAKTSNKEKQELIETIKTYKQ